MSRWTARWIRDPNLDSGDVLIDSSDDYNYPATRDAAIQAFVLPKTSTYSIVVTGYAGSSGDYRLYFLPGFDVLALHDATMEKTKWKVAYSDTAIDVSESSMYAVELEGFARSAAVVGEHFPKRRITSTRRHFMKSPPPPTGTWV